MNVSETTLHREIMLEKQVEQLREACEYAEKAFREPAGRYPIWQVAAIGKLRAAIAATEPKEKL